MSLALVSSHCLFIGLACDALLDIEEPTRRADCTTSACLSGAPNAGTESSSGRGGEPSDAVAGAGGEAGDAPRAGDGGHAGTPGYGGDAGESASSGTGGDPAGAGTPGTAGENAAGSAGSGDATCEDDTLRCDAFQPQQCASGRWLAVGEECLGYCQDGACKEAPSCLPDAPTGNCDNVGTSCCETIWVPGGAYQMGLGDDETPDDSYSREVGGFYLDRFEVTVGRFEAFLQEYALPPAGGGRHPRIPESGWREEWEELLHPDFEPDEVKVVPPTRTAVVAQLTDPVHCEASTFATTSQLYPINCVNWYLAFAFCVYDGGRLPTEAEWNYVAARGAEHRPYPWSRGIADIGIEGRHAAFNESGIPSDLPPAVGTHSDGQGGFFRIQGRGHEDLAGSVAEWTADGWEESPSPTCESDCMHAWTTEERVPRGGSYQNPARFLRTGFRTSADAEHIHPVFGFRCARDAEVEVKEQP